MEITKIFNHRVWIKHISRINNNLIIFNDSGIEINVGRKHPAF